MAAIASLLVRLDVNDGNGNVRTDVNRTARFSVGAGVSGKHEQVSLSGNAFTSLSPPSGAKLVIIEPASAAVSVTLKGVTGDTGVAVLPSSNPLGIPLVMPLGSSPSIGFQNSGAATSVDVWWL